MSIIDRHALNNRLRAVDSAYKAGPALRVLLASLMANRPAVGVLAAAWMGLVAWRIL